MSRARSFDELQPVLELCRKGKLFEVQEWIASGGPVGRPEPPEHQPGKKDPLRIAMELGFHSLVKVLLQAGAPWRDGSYNALRHAVDLQRPDLAELLLDHGADVASVPMDQVFQEYLPETIELFIARGGDLETGYPLSCALIDRVRPALGVYKRHCQRFPSFKAQLDVALRHHAFKGDAKWVSLLLWVGADPLAAGTWDPNDLDDDPEEFSTALELAATGGHVEVLKLKAMAALCRPGLPHSAQLLASACEASSSELLAMLLELGHRPDSLPDGGTKAISHLVHWMALWFPPENGSPDDRRLLDNDRARECMKTLHMLVAHGGMWLPGDKASTSDMRRSLLKLTADYTLELVWILGRYKAARLVDVKALVGSASMKRHVGGRAEELRELVGRVGVEAG
ncbi:MAG: hypothetical protein ABIJ09_17855 [Pseudomonadota bacterium]